MRRLLLALSLVLAALSQSEAMARQSSGWRVAFTSGSTLDVESYAVEGARVVLFLQEGGTFVVDAARIRSLQPVTLPRQEPPPPAAAPQTAPPADIAPAPAFPEPAPAQPATPAGPADLDTLIREAAARHGLEADLLAAVIAVESGYRIDAVSPKGAGGLMQLMPGTARELAVTDVFDPAQNIDAGARHLKRLIEQHGGTWWKALAAYNAGEGTVARYRGLPPYRETMSYVKKVLDRYARPRPIPNGPAAH